VSYATEKAQAKEADVAMKSQHADRGNWEKIGDSRFLAIVYSILVSEYLVDKTWVPELLVYQASVLDGRGEDAIRAQAVTRRIVIDRRVRHKATLAQMAIPRHGCIFTR